MSVFKRPSKDVTWLRIARDLAEQSTCLRRAVGCVLLDARGHVLSTGWNGVAAGEPHCNEFTELTLPEVRFKEAQGETNIIQVDDRVLGWFSNGCKGAKAPSGTQLESCGAIHAEQNAIASCRLPYEVHTCYVTHSPCNPCVKLLLSSTCQRVVFINEYADQSAKGLWLKNGRAWEQVAI